MSESGSDDENGKKRVKNAVDLQRLKLEKLMKNPEREVEIPEMRETKKPRAFNPHEFVRNVMGASSGAGSGEFDIYRGCRRREQIRQEFLQAEADKKKELEEFENLRKAHQLEAEKKTAKKRAKRLKQKQKAKNGKNKKQEKESDEESDSNNEAEEEIEIDLDEKVGDTEKEVKVDETKADDSEPVPKPAAVAVVPESSKE